jgi:hypothetical protein
VRELRFSSEGTDLLTADNAPKGDLQENASLSDLRSPGGGGHCVTVKQYLLIRMHTGDVQTDYSGMKTKLSITKQISSTYL